MKKHMRATVLAAILAISPAAANAITTSGPGGFNNGFATSITYDENAARGTTFDRDNPLNALGPNNGNFFEIGFGSFIDLTFGTLFDTEATVFEVTFGNPAGFPESAVIFAGVGDGTFGGGSFTSLGSISNVAAQGGAIISLLGFTGPFDTIRIFDTSTPINNAKLGGFDVDAVRVAAVPLPAALPLIGAGFAALGFVGWRRKRKAA